MSDIVSLLRERPYRLASESNTEMQVRRQSEREYAAHEIEVLRLEKARLAAENDRLRAALEEIEYLDRPQSRGLPRRISIEKIARAALEEK